MASGSRRTGGGDDSEELGLDAYPANFNSRAYWSASLIDDLLGMPLKSQIPPPMDLRTLQTAAE